MDPNIDPYLCMGYVNVYLECFVWLFVALAGLVLCQTELQKRPPQIKHTQGVHQRCPCK